MEITTYWDDRQTPLERGAANTIYQIKDEVNGETRIAWYRLINSTDIHSKTSKAKAETWIFE